MLEFWKDGTKIECEFVDEAKVGQMLVMTHVGWGNEHPFKKYPQPSHFSVVSSEKASEYRTHYTLRDSAGNDFPDMEIGIGFCDAQAWATWSAAKHVEDLRQMNACIQHVESQVALLRSILVEQGVKLITPAQASTLGIAVSAGR